MDHTKNLELNYVARIIVVLVLAVIVFQPVSQLCQDGIEEDIELAENSGEEDSEKEADDMEESAKLLHQFAVIEYLNKRSHINKSEYYLELKSQFKKGVKSPPPENTLFTLL